MSLKGRQVKGGPSLILRQELHLPQASDSVFALKITQDPLDDLHVDLVLVGKVLVAGDDENGLVEVVATTIHAPWVIHSKHLGGVLLLGGGVVELLIILLLGRVLVAPAPWLISNMLILSGARQ